MTTNRETCDRCPQWAVHRATPRGMTWDDAPNTALYFCGHHSARNTAALVAAGWTVHPIPIRTPVAV